MDVTTYFCSAAEFAASLLDPKTRVFNKPDTDLVYTTKIDMINQYDSVNSVPSTAHALFTNAIMTHGKALFPSKTTVMHSIEGRVVMTRIVAGVERDVIVKGVGSDDTAILMELSQTLFHGVAIETATLCALELEPTSSSISATDTYLIALGGKMRDAGFESNRGILMHLVKDYITKVATAKTPTNKKAAAAKPTKAERDWKEHGIPIPVQTPKTTGEITKKSTAKKLTAKKFLLQESAKDDATLSIIDKMQRDRNKRLDEASTQDDRTIDILVDMNLERKIRTMKFAEIMDEVSSSDGSEESDKEDEAVALQQQPRVIVPQRLFPREPEQDALEGGDEPPIEPGVLEPVVARGQEDVFDGGDEPPFGPGGHPVLAPVVFLGQEDVFDGGDERIPQPLAVVFGSPSETTFIGPRQEKAGLIARGFALLSDAMTPRRMKKEKKKSLSPKQTKAAKAVTFGPTTFNGKEENAPPGTPDVAEEGEIEIAPTPPPAAMPEYTANNPRRSSRKPPKKESPLAKLFSIKNNRRGG